MAAVTVGVLGALLGAGGSVAGGILGSKSSVDVGSAVDRPISYPLNAAATLQSLALLGGPLNLNTILQASPMNQVLNAGQARPVSRGSERKGRARLQRSVELFIQAREAGSTQTAREILVPQRADPGMDQVFALGGFLGLDDFMEAEYQFRKNAPRILAEVEGVRDRNLQISKLSQEARISALGSADVDELRNAEEARLLRDIELRRPELLAAANAGGFNPAGGLEQLERARSDSSLDALVRALGLAQGNLGVAQQAASLDPNLIGLGVAPSILGLTGSNLLGTTVFSQSNTDVGGGIERGAAALGGGLSNSGLIAQDQRNTDEFLSLLRSQDTGSASPAGGGNG